MEPLQIIDKLCSKALMIFLKTAFLQNRAAIYWK